MWFEQILARGEQRMRDRICLRDVRRDVTWQQFRSETRALAGFIQSRSVPGDRIMILSGNRVEFFVIYFACALVGVVAMPVNPTLTDEELTYINGSALPLLAIADRAGRARLSASGFAADVVAIEDIVDLEADPATPLRESQAADPCIMFHTSATTGRPKGVLVDQRYFQLQALSWIAETGVLPGSVYLNSTSLFHGSIIVAFDYLAALGVIGVLESFTPRGFIEAVGRWEVSCTMLVPAMITLLLLDRKVSLLKGGPLQSIISAGAPLLGSLAAELRNVIGIDPRVIFGTTEAGVTLHKSSEDGRTHLGHDGGSCAGRAIIGFSVRIVEDGEEQGVLQADEVGMIQFKSDALMLGYWNNVEATEKAIRGGWLTTGDLGYQDADQFIWVIDRRPDMILRGGQNVYPAEIERVLLQSPQVGGAAVVAAPSDTWGQTPVAFIESSVAELDTSDLLRLCVRELASYKRPSRFVVVDKLPRNALGKVLRLELRQRAAALKQVESA